MNKETEEKAKAVARYLQPRVCENCGHVILNNNRKFCSNECYLAAKRNGWKPSLYKSKAHSMEKRMVCVVCAEIVPTYYRHPKDVPSVFFCSERCRKKYTERKRKIVTPIRLRKEGVENVTDDISVT